ncbi:Glutamate receptor 2.9 [Morella rubra]|uniref:Glutamate receptor 2.9 n=1 Tax=Morella rubra TaxID=262757 RepID=A0A6A1WJV8_9ROSI|nr:Glutamate receptor 2.9 [Morella rubra]
MQAYFVIELGEKAQAISAIIKAFGWREAVPIYEDNDFGEGIVPSLVDALQYINLRVPYRSVIPPSATDDEIGQELYKLMTMQTRVFIVHMSPNLSSPLFTKANEIGMMGEALARAVEKVGTANLSFEKANASSALTDLETIRVSQIGPKLCEALQTTRFIGLGEPRYVPKGWEIPTNGKKLRIGVPVKDGFNEFIKVTHDNSTNTTVLESPWGLLTNRIRDWTIQQWIASLLDPVPSLSLPTDQSELIILYAAILMDVIWFSRNQVMRGGRRDDFGTIIRRIHRLYVEHSKAWSAFVPIWSIRWSPPCGNGWKINFDVAIWSHCSMIAAVCRNHVGSILFAWPKRSPPGTPLVGEAQAALFAVQEASFLGYPLIDFEGDNLQHFDAVVGDTTITANRSKYVDFTLPFTESGVSMVVPLRDSRPKNAWVFLKPLTNDLWIASGCFFVFIGFVVWVLEHRINSDFSAGDWSHQLGTSLWFAFSTLVFAQSVWFLQIFLLLYGFQAFRKGSLLVADVSRAILNVTEGDQMKVIEDGWLGTQTNCPDSNPPVSFGSLSLSSFSVLANYF